MANLTTKPYTDDDHAEFSRGFDHGNYANAYESESYNTRPLAGQTGFFRIGHLLGFFSSYELNEIPLSEEVNGASCRDETERYRQEFARWV